MERTIKEQLNYFLNNFNAKEINHYFAVDFSDDWDNIYIKEKYSNIEEVLSYLNDSFIDIDLKYVDTDVLDEEEIRKILIKALEMLS